MDELRISQLEVEKLLSKSFRIGYQEAMAEAGERPKYISQNRAYRTYGKSRVQNWVAAGLLAVKPNGNGKTSTKQYEQTRLMTLDASNAIVIRKPWSPQTPLKPSKP
jgi:hypothetical protein